MVTNSATDPPRRSLSQSNVVDPRAPRFGQAITAAGLLLGILTGRPEFIFAIGIVLVTAVVSRWRLNLYGILFKNVVRPVVDMREPEAAVPHRFAMLVGAIGTSLASGLVLIGQPLAGYVVAGIVALAAGLAATTGFCLGCRMYRQVSHVRRLSIV